MKIPVTADGPLFDLLQAHFPDASKNTIRKMLRNERVVVGGRVITEFHTQVKAGQVVEVTSRRGISARPPGEILYRDEHIIAVEKPAGILSVARDRTGGEETFYRLLNDYVQETSNQRERIFIVHRLDREASGVMVFALHPRIQERLQTNWHDTEKRYWALVEGRPEQDSGTIRSFLRENSVHRVYSTVEGPEAKLSVTHYRVRRTGTSHSLLEVRIETGRKNQIRVHLSDLGCPIAGDRKYGAHSDPLRRLGLHAFLLAFDHPATGKRMRLRSPMPGAFRV